MSRVSEVFRNLRASGNAALIGYIMAGDPNPEMTPTIAGALIKGGVDILELGLPFSDPIADGPTIQAASTRALAAGTTPKKVLAIAQTINKKQDVPIVVMTYYNPVFRMGAKKFFHAAKECGVDGTIIPDLPMEESLEYQGAAEANGVDTIFLAAPSTSSERLRKIVEHSSGFLYLVSRFGVTGEKTSLEDSTISLIKRVLPITSRSGKLPLAVGFGISRPEHVRQIVNAGADGAIVGSVFVNMVSHNRANIKEMIKELEESARGLKDATVG